MNEDQYWKSEDFDPERDRQRLQVHISEMGMDWLSFNGLLLAEWRLFEARLDAWCRREFSQSGVNVADWVRQKHRSRFKSVLKRIYGTCDVDPDCEVKLPIPNEEELTQRFRARASNEFGVRRGGAGGSLAETLAGIAAARAAMTAPPNKLAVAIEEAEVAPEPAEEREPDWGRVAEETLLEGLG